jgi:uncharacterized protein YndB with AHSA1/START domain
MTILAETDPDPDEFVLSRVLDAPRDLVFKAWTEAQRLKEWWGPKGFKVISCAMDLRPGGRFLYGLRTPDGGEMWGRWILREVVAPERLVFIVSFSDPEGGVTRHPWSETWPLETLSTVEFAEQGRKTLVTVRWRPWNASDTERQTFATSHDSMNQGWSGTMEQLTEYLVKA